MTKVVQVTSGNTVYTIYRDYGSAQPPYFWTYRDAEGQTYEGRAVTPEEADRAAGRRFSGCARLRHLSVAVPESCMEATA